MCSHQSSVFAEVRSRIHVSCVVLWNLCMLGDRACRAIGIKSVKCAALMRFAWAAPFGATVQEGSITATICSNLCSNLWALVPHFVCSQVSSFVGSAHTSVFGVLNACSDIPKWCLFTHTSVSYFTSCYLEVNWVAELMQAWEHICRTLGV